jgi:hypothetical protein
MPQLPPDTPPPLRPALTAAPMQPSWSHESITSPAVELPTYDVNAPRLHRRRTSLPVHAVPGAGGSSSSAAAPDAVRGERRRFRDSVAAAAAAATSTAVASGSSSSSTGAGIAPVKRRRSSQAPGARSASRRRSNVPAGALREEEDSTSAADGPANGTSSRRYSSTYAAGPSGRGALDGSTSSDSTSSDRQVFDWDVRRSTGAPSREARGSFDDRNSSVRARRMRAQLDNGRPSPPLRVDSSARGSAGTASPNVQGSSSGIARTASPVPPAGQSRLQLPGANAGRAAGKSGLASPVLRTSKLDGSPAHGTPPSADASGPPRPPRPKIKRRLNVGALAEGALILGAGAYACWELASSPSARVRSHVLGEYRRSCSSAHC